MYCKSGNKCVCVIAHNTHLFQVLEQRTCPVGSGLLAMTTSVKIATDALLIIECLPCYLLP